jgi:MFS family permease
MSSVTHTEPGTGTATGTPALRRSRLVGMPLALTFMAEFASLTSFLLLISVLPMLAAAAGASSAAVGLITGALLAAAGVTDSFLPLARGVPSTISSAALLVLAITATISRWQAGRHGDRYGHARLLIPATAVATLGMAAMVWLASPVAIFAGMFLFGAGFGVVENSTFALLIERLPEAKASALWNLAYDAGYGAGPVMFGLFSAHTGYPAAFAITGVLILAALPAARSRPLDRHVLQ